jgi:hypothetical protein
MNICDVGMALVTILNGNVGRPLVGLLNGNKDSFLYCPGDPQGASLHFLHNRLTHHFPHLKLFYDRAFFFPRNHIGNQIVPILKTLI